MTEQTWTKEMLDNYLEDNGGDTLGLIDCFPFTENDMEKITKALADEDNYTDSEVCDLILELANKSVEDDTYDCCANELTELVATIGTMENTFAEREVQGDILDQLHKAQEIIKGALNDVKDIMKGNNPYA